MARFSALTSDSSDDEQPPYTQDAQKQPPGAPTMSVDMDQDLPSSGSEEDEDIEVDEDEEEDESEDTDMDEDDRVERPAVTRNQALVEDSDGEVQYQLRAQSRPGSSSSSGSDSDSAVRRPGAKVASWAGRAGVDPQKMHVMQTSLFRMPEEAAALQAMNKPTRPRFKLSPTVSRKHSRDSVGDARFDSQEVRGSLSYCLHLSTVCRGLPSLTISNLLFTGHPASMRALTYRPLLWLGTKVH